MKTFLHILSLSSLSIIVHPVMISTITLFNDVKEKISLTLLCRIKENYYIICLQWLYFYHKVLHSVCFLIKLIQSDILKDTLNTYWHN